jgi:hypothetical protein
LAGRILGSNTMVQGAIPDILKNTPQSFYDNLVNTLHVSTTIFLEIPGSSEMRKYQNDFVSMLTLNTHTG